MSYCCARLVHRTARCPPNASEPDIGPEDERCGGPFFWSKSTPAREIEDESCHIGNPIAVGTGLKTQTEPDIPATGHVPGLERTYRSQIRFAASDSFGPNWTHQWNRQIQISSPSSETVAVLRGDGSAKTFQKSGAHWISTSGPETITQISADGSVTGWRYFDATEDSVESGHIDARHLHAIALGRLGTGNRIQASVGMAGYLDAAGGRCLYWEEAAEAPRTNPGTRSRILRPGNW
ncbi:DUF6531 domain-containing protein [Cupriavidus sp. EM10]|uniref:DUF6531 domain-containing protein n=1 Tax=Cupriavidus sp. EM10 TaxID=2839983 RepID=UPI001CEDE7BD